MAYWRKLQESSMAIMRALLMIVFLGWLMMWVVMPTKTFRNKWSPKLFPATFSTYFGAEGTWLLIFTFPILFIAVTGCIYLHLLERSPGGVQSSIDSNSGWEDLTGRLRARWRRVAVVKGPLGVMSTTELVFCLMFLVLVLWAACMYITQGFSGLNSAIAAEYGEKLWEAQLYNAGLQLGLVGNMCVAFLFIPVARGSSLLPLVGLTSECSIRFHVWLGHIVMTLFTAHGLCFFVVWAASSRLFEALNWASVGISNIAGEVALLCGLVMWAMSFPQIRRRMFELFFYAHHLYIPFLVFYLLHVDFSCFCLILPGVYLFLVDRFLRLLQSRRSVRLLSARLLPSEVMELNFAKSSGFNYRPTSVVFIKVASVSELQWHPFTVSSSSSLEPDTLSIIIKKEGRWTQKLFEQLSNPSIERLQVAIEGPYGPASVDFLNYDSLVLVTGGSGITPCISIIRELLHLQTAGFSKTPTILLVASFKTTADVAMLDLLLPTPAATFSPLELQVMAFVTREKSPPPADDYEAQTMTTIKTVKLHPNPSDAALAPVLGPNGWFWLAAVISSSFLAFLLLVGILTRYYIYPIDGYTGDVFSDTKRSLLYLLFMCSCVSAAAGFAVLWNKMTNSKAEEKLAQALGTNEPAPQPPAFSSLWAVQGGGDCVPKVCYGARPNLKKILLEVGERSKKIGVLASGPSSLRREVAAICSSPLVDHLQYKSMSFSW